MPNHEIPLDAAYKYRGAFAITPHNSTNFDVVARAFYVGDITSGDDATVVTAQGEVVLLTGLEEGHVYELALIRVNATGTSAASLVGLY